MSFWTKIKSVRAALLPDCREAARTQSDQLEKPLPAPRRFGLFLHLLACKWCRRYGRQIRSVHKTTRGQGEKLVESAPQTLSSAGRERIKQKLRDQS